jgi:hypothetical protein
MRRLIKSKLSGLFLAESGEWAPFAKARSFPDPVQAAQHSKALNLVDIELYYSFDERQPSQFDFVLSLGSAEPLKVDPFALKKAGSVPRTEPGATGAQAESC